MRTTLAGATLVISIAVATLAPELLAKLTDAEASLVPLVVEGLSNAEIGRRRGSTAKTVANQLHEVYRKLGIRSRTELTALVAHGTSSTPTRATSK